VDGRNFPYYWFEWLSLVYGGSIQWHAMIEYKWAPEFKKRWAELRQRDGLAPIE